MKKNKKLCFIILFFFTLIGDLMGSSLPKYFTKTLGNGLQIVAIPMHNNTNVISTNIFYKVGSRNETMGKSGIAHMLEHLNFKSTKNLKTGEFDTIVKSFGGVNNASTGFDNTHYYITSSSKNLNKSLELFAELLENLSLKDKEFQPERKVVAEERRWRTDNNPMGYLQFKLFNNAYLYHSYHWTPIGFMNDIQNWTIEDIKDFHSTYYQPKNAVIIVAGDISKEEIFKNAEKHFNNIKNTKEIPNFDYRIEPKQNGEKNIIVHKDSAVDLIAMAYHIPNFSNKDQVALSALSELLSLGRSSILQEELVDKKRLVNNVYAYNMELKDPGLFLFFAVANENIDAKDIRKEFLSIITKIKKGDFSKEDLNKVKINTKAEFIFSLENSSSVASLFGQYFVKDNVEPLLNYENNIDSLNKKDIIDVANKYLNIENSTTVILKPKK